MSKRESVNISRVEGSANEERRGLSPADKKYLAKIRKLLSDYATPDSRVWERIDYLERFARKIIRTELEKYAKSK